MSLLAVADRKFFRGVEPPGTSLSGKRHARGTPWCKVGAPATYDWRSPPGPPDNTAAIEPHYTLIDHDSVLGGTYATDAHFVAYALRQGGTPERKQPRINKGGRPWVESLGYTLDVSTLVADVDNLVPVPGQEKPEHRPWASDAIAIAAAQRVHQALRTAAVYVTARGLRVVQPLTSARAAGEEIEVCLRLWLALLEERLAPLGLAPDWECKDWTRVFRAPNVVRDGRFYRSPAVLRTCTPILPPSGVLRASPGRERARRRNPIPGELRIDRHLEPGWAAIAENLAAHLAAKYQGERHAVGLSLAGALLQSRVPREQVPAFVEHVAGFSGWDVEHHRGSAIDTVRRWSDGHGVSGLSALPESVRDAIAGELSERRARADAAPVEAAPAAESLDATMSKLQGVIGDAPIGLSVVKAQCGLGKTYAARVIAKARAEREGDRKPNTKSAIAVPTTALALQVYEDLRAAGVRVRRLFGPLSVRGDRDGYACHYRATAAALAEGGQSTQKLFCERCEHAPTCAAKSGFEGDSDARVLVGPHALLAELDEGAGSEGLVFIDEPPPLLEDEVFPLDELVDAERVIGNFEANYVSTMRPVLAAVRAWVEIAAPEETGSIARAMPAEDAEIARSYAAELPAVPPLDRYSAIAARTALPLAVRLGRASKVLRAVRRALVRSGVRATVYDRGGRSLAITGLDLDVENAILGARRDGTSKDRRVVVAGADAHLHLAQYREILGADPAFHDFAAPDGAPIRRVHLVCDGSRARLASDDTGPIDVAARMAAEWAIEFGLASCGVVTFKRHELAVLRALQAAAPAIRWEVAHYGAVRGLDRWKDFDGVATIGDPRPNLDAVSRELGGGGAEVESRYDRADAHARSELEQAHGRLRTVHRTRPGFALHLGALLPGSWRDPIEYRRPTAGRMRRPVTPGLAGLVEAAGGQRAASRAVGRSLSSVQRWLRGEGRPEAADVEALRRAGTERRLSEDVSGDPERSLGSLKGLPGQSVSNDSMSIEPEAAE